MFHKILNSKEIITGDFLFYSWKEFRRNKQNLLDVSILESFRPIPKSWFKRTAFLIKQGKYPYFYKVNNLFKSGLNYQKVSLHNLKIKIIETAYFLILKLYYFEVYFTPFIDVRLTECLRLLIK